MAARKKFFSVDIPLTNSSFDVYANSINELEKKSIKLDLTRHLRGKSIEVIFKIKVENNKATASPFKLTLLPFFIRRMLRKNISYVEDSLPVTCKDAELRIKPFLITRKKVSRKVRKALRNEMKIWIEDYCKSRPYKEIFADIIGNRMQKPLSLKLKKIYPLALCEIRILKIEKLKEKENLKVTIEKITKEKAENKKIQNTKQDDAKNSGSN